MEKKSLVICVLYAFISIIVIPLSNAKFIKTSQDVPLKIKPISYDLTIEPNLKASTFQGTIIIQIKPTEEITNITINAANLEIDQNDVSLKTANGKIIPIIDMEFVWYQQTCTIILGDKILPTEEYLLNIKFTGDLRTDNLGFYLGKHLNEKGIESYFANTQFSKTNARSAFPCFDEPALKASFTIKIIRPKGYNSVSNEEISKTVELENGRFLDEYKEIHNISTYLVAFAVSQFNFTRKNGIHQISGRPELLNEGKAEYALEIAPEALKAVEDYVGMKFTFPKITHLAIPDRYFTGEALENWGLITYNEKTLLIPNETSTIIEKQTTLTSMLHELIHQWFGNLVTPSDWKYLWLSEGFATYLQFRIGNIMEPSWKLLAQFHTIILERAYEGEILGFETELDDGAIWVPYLKAASIIRMLEHVLTPEAFQKGLQRYLKDNQFQASQPSDLYNAMDTVVKELKIQELLGNNTVTDIMNTWETGNWYPVVNVTRDYQNGHITFEQNVMAFFGDAKNNHLWSIPINYVLNSNNSEEFSKTTADFWLTQKQLSPSSNSFVKDGWLIVNKQALGYYRVNYDVTNWERLIFFLCTQNFETIHVLNRAQLLSDSFALARYGKLSYEIPLSLTAYLVQERMYIPFASFFNEIEYLNRCLAPTDIYPTFKNYIIGILGGIHEHLGFEEKADDHYLDKLNRNNVIKWFCKLGRPECRNHALGKLREWKVKEAMDISPYLRETLLCGAVQAGNQEDWDFLFAKFQNETDGEKRSQILKALTCSEDEKIINKFLQTMENFNNTDFKEGERSTAIVAIIESGRVGRNVATNYIRGRFKHFWALGSMRTILNTIGSRMVTETEAQELTAFKNEFRGSHMAFRPGMAFASMNVHWGKLHLEEITKWLTTGPNTNAAI